MHVVSRTNSSFLGDPVGGLRRRSMALRNRAVQLMQAAAASWLPEDERVYLLDQAETFRLGE
jgi:hypothetical protein